MTSSFVVNFKGAAHTSAPTPLENTSLCISLSGRDSVSTSSTSSRRAAEIRGTKSAAAKVGLPRAVSLFDIASSSVGQVRNSASLQGCPGTSSRINRMETVRCSTWNRSRRSTDSERRCFPTTEREPVAEEDEVGAEGACTSPLRFFHEQNSLDDTLSFTPGKSDLLVVGPGVLGSLVAQQWFKANEGECNVVGQTNTTNRHEQLRSIGIIPVVKGAHKGEKFPYVIFCAPPSGSEDYAAEVRAAAERWNGEGSLLFTSSSALYGVSDNGICDEETAPIVLKGAGPRTDRLHGAEEEILKVGGNVVRLVGLYALERGAHSYYLSQGTIAQRGDHIVNLIHYEDAASLCVAILRGEHRGRIFLGCDNHPVSRQEIMDAVNKSGKYDKKFDGFTSTDGPLGKKINNDPTRRATGWKPKYESFPSFLGVTLDKK